jgi:sugar/nucleoside kinase (ribokinase family)
LRRANLAAALSCRGLDGRSAIPTAAELDEEEGGRD